MSDARRTRLTLGALRAYVDEGRDGSLLLPEAGVDWSAPLGPAVNDSRAVVPGALFVALRGERTDGHRFAAASGRAGAAALLLAELPDDLPPARPLVWLAPDPLAALQGFARWWRAGFPQTLVIGVTGSVGKTTAKDVIAAALSRHMPVLASPRSFNNEIGLPLTLLALESSHRAAVLEMGIFDVGDITFLAAIARHTAAVVLNVEGVHLERAGTIERIAQAKAEIVETLPPNGITILNYDDPRVRAMRTLAPSRVITFGQEAGADWRASDVQALPDGLLMSVTRSGATYAVCSALPGAHHMSALLAAAAVLEVAGVPLDQIAGTLETVPAPAARQRFLRRPSGGLLIDDSYNASPLSMFAALDLLAAQQAPRKVAILADMLELGPASEARHLEVGQHAASRADLVLAVGPLARAISDAAGRGALWFPEKGSLCERLGTVLRSDDAVLVKGSRGMMMEEVVACLLRMD